MGRDGREEREEKLHERGFQSKACVAPGGVCLSVWGLDVVPPGPVSLGPSAGVSLWCKNWKTSYEPQLRAVAFLVNVCKFTRLTRLTRP